MTAVPAQRIELIPVDRIVVVNPRVRNPKLFKEIVDNIAAVGLKRPITVTRRMEAGGPYYDLVCGQGRLEAFVALNQSEVPALVVSANSDDCLVASLVENCARRRHRAVDLLQDIGGMKSRGDTHAEISRKTGLSPEYVYAVVRLLENGEEKLLRAVETGQIPFSVALEIAEADDQDVQAALQSAYDKNLLRGRKLMMAKKIIERRRQQGKSLKFRDQTAPVSSRALLQAYQEDTAAKQALIRKADITRSQLILITEALKRLLSDSEFRGLLHSENLGSIPEPIALRISEPGH